MSSGKEVGTNPKLPLHLRISNWLLAVSSVSDVALASFAAIAPAIPPPLFVKLAGYFRNRGRDDLASRLLAAGRRRHPMSISIWQAYARQLHRTGQFLDAIVEWTALIAAGAEIKPSDYRDLSRSLSASGQTRHAETWLTIGLQRWPEDRRLQAERGRQALARGRAREAIEVFQVLIEEAPNDIRPWAYRHLAAAHLQQGERESAVLVIEAGLCEFPENHVIELGAARLLLSGEEGAQVAARWLALARRHSSHLTEQDFVQALRSQRRVGDLGSACEIVGMIVSQKLRSPLLASEVAQVGMAQGDWASALSGWQDFVEYSTRPARLPRRGSPPDWYELAWQELVGDWDSAAQNLGRRPSADLFRAICRTLQEAEMKAEALSLLRRAFLEYPDDAQVAFALAEAELRFAPAGPVEQAERLQSVFRDAPAVDSAISGLIDRVRDRSGVLNLRADVEEDQGGGLGSLRILRLPPGSTLELEAKAGHYLTTRDIERLTKELSVVEKWDELHSSSNLLLQRAHQYAKEYGRRFEDLPWLPADTLADASLLFFYHELALFLPASRLARDLSTRVEDDPVFIELPGSRLKYLDGYTYGRFDLIYLFFELKRHGANVHLCLIEEAPASPPVLEFAPSVRFLKAPNVSRASEQPYWDEALFPAGIRSVQRLSQELPEALVYASGSLIKEFAYDRSLHGQSVFDSEASIHPPKLPLPAIRVPLATTRTIHGRSLLTDGTKPVSGEVQLSEPIGGDWLAWLDRVLHESFRELAVRAVAEVSARGIQTAHVCDHIFPDAAIFSEAVKQRGGRVVLWPHSANPAHVGIRRVDSFDEVHAVTRKGVGDWRTAYPTKVVHQTPGLMLPGVRASQAQSADPISVVIIGGRPVLGSMPVLDVAAHESSYRSLFLGLDELHRSHSISVWFKPRGLTGEHEWWLHQTVGRLASWRPVYEHPLRMKLPNLLFVSVSVGSSALMEGLSRGVPGLVVRDFPVRDYTAFSDGTIPVLKTPKALDVIRRCCDVGGLEDLLGQQLPEYLEEFRSYVDCAGVGEASET